MDVLGQTIREAIALDDAQLIDAPANVTKVVMTCHEFTSLCPVTGQPDFGAVRITYQPLKKMLESKSLKLWLYGYRNRGSFCEALADEIASEFMRVVKPLSVDVLVIQQPRGGISIEASASCWSDGGPDASAN